jgi:hypothetical protein
MPAGTRILDIVVVHGTGFPEPGVQIGRLMQGLANAGYGRELENRVDPDHARKPEGSSRDDVPLTGYRMVELPLVTPEGDRVRLWDANWAALNAAPARWPALALFFGRLLLSTTAYAGKESFWGALFNLLMGGLLLWLPLLVALSLWNLLLPEGAFFFVGILFAVGMYWGARALDRAMAATPPDPRIVAVVAGKLWAAAALAVAVWQIFRTGPLLDPDLVARHLPLRVIVACILLAGPFLILMTFLGLWRKDVPGTSGERRRAAVRAVLSLTGLLAAAFILLTGASAAFLAINLLLAGELTTWVPPLSAGLLCWDAAYARALPYRIFPAEIVSTWATVIVGAVALAAYFRWNSAVKSGNEARQRGAGPRFRQDMQRTVVLILVCLAATTLLIAGDMVERLSGVRIPVLVDVLDVLAAWLPWLGRPSLDPPDDAVGLLAIYSQSALRLVLPLLGLRLIPVALDHMADVLLYLHDKTHQQEMLRKAVRTARERAEGEGSASATVLAAHSQGSRIALDIAREADLGVVRVATVGSPVAVLYGTFLDQANLDGWLEEEPRERRIAWANFWRGSDFIGGPVPGLKTDFEIVDDLESNHHDYWLDEKVVRFLLSGELPENPAASGPAGNSQTGSLALP